MFFIFVILGSTNFGSTEILPINKFLKIFFYLGNIFYFMQIYFFFALNNFKILQFLKNQIKAYFMPGAMGHPKPCGVYNSARYGPSAYYLLLSLLLLIRSYLLTRSSASGINLIDDQLQHQYITIRID